MNQMKQLALAALTAVSAIATPGASAAIGLTPAAPEVTQDFNSMWDGAAGTLTLPDGWHVDRNLDAPRRVGAWNDAATEVMYAGGVSLASNAKNGT